MTAKRFRLEDRTLLATSSTRRYVTFGIDNFDGKPYVIKRTDSLETAFKNHAHWAGRLDNRVVTIDFGYQRRDRFNEIETVPASILADKPARKVSAGPLHDEERYR